MQSVNDLPPTRRLADLLLAPEGLDAFVQAGRSRGVAWRRLATDLKDATGVDVTYETLRSWYPEHVGGGT